MKLSTKGEFGGLGFVIQMKEGNLTVVKVLPKTPARTAPASRRTTASRRSARSPPSTWTSTRPSSKLRGPVDSRGHHHRGRARAGTSPRSMTLTRAHHLHRVACSTSCSRSNVGYVRLKNFQGNTTRDLRGARSTELRKQAEAKGGMKGLVLDLRGNPGGLLEQAIQVSDTFLSNGTIVATVGLSDKLREEEARAPDGGRGRLPHRGAGERRQRLGLGDCRRRAQEPEPRRHHRPADVRQGQRAGALRLPGRQRAQADHRQVPHPRRRLHPGGRHRPGHRSSSPPASPQDRVNVFAPRKSMGEADLDQHFGNPDSATVAKKREDVLGPREADGRASST